MHTALLSTPPAAARPAPRAIQIAAASALRRPAPRPALARRTPPASVGASPSLRPARPARRVGGAVAVRARGGGADDAPLVERAAAAAAYVFPLFDAIRFARFLFLAYPATRAVLIPLQPLAKLYFSVPFASLAVFFGLYLGIVRNDAFSRFLRYHAAQAVVLDVILVLPGLLESLFRPPSSGVGLQLFVTLSNTVAIFAAACFVVGAGSALLGKTVRLPIVADAADGQVGGF